jgi:G:T-mismatch repair DNA endonuclease (very short patch repair protein)
LILKLARNPERDRDTDRRLAEVGWTAIRVWKHENPEEAAGRVEAVVREGSLREKRHAAIRVSSHGTGTRATRTGTP